MKTARRRLVGRKISRVLGLGILLPLLPLALVPSSAAASGGGFSNIASGGKCLTDPNSSKSIVQLVMEPCSGSVTQDWLTLTPPSLWIIDSGDPNPVIRNVYSQYCLDLAGDNPAFNGVAAWQYPCNEGDGAQTMTIIFNHQPPTSGPMVIQDNHGTCLDDKDGGKGNGNPVWFYQCNATSAQQWDFTVDKGQHLALHDIGGRVYSVKLEGINQNCSNVQPTFNFPSAFLDITNYYWTTFCGFPGNGSGVVVYMYSGANLGGSYLGYQIIQVPDWQTYTNWYSSEIDGGSNEYPGENSV
jgi:hypothetical protein